ncbi:unnamed protein product [Heterobilharzia americana]|nr:unnamed protein product [Heterobilharzia americana]
MCSHVYDSYCLRISFNPIMGVDEDIQAFTEEFSDLGSPRFVDFSELWKQHKMIHLIHGRQNQHGLYDILGCVFHRLVDLFQPAAPKNKLVRICALYLLYAFHGKQPIRNHVRIRVCPVSWLWILQVVTEARDEGHLDVYYVFRKLCAANAFHFCATRQVFYPGAPLFDSPVVKQSETTEGNISPPENISETVKPGFSQRRDLLTCSLPVVKAIQSSSGIDQAVQCLNLSLSRYAEAKRSLTQKLKVTGENVDLHSFRDQDNPDTEEKEDEFLPGLNFVNFPDSLNRIEMLAMELEKLIKQNEVKFCTIRRTKYNISSPSADESPNQNVQIPTDDDHFETPCPGIVVGSVIVENKSEKHKNVKKTSGLQSPNKNNSVKQSLSRLSSKTKVLNSVRKSEEKVNEREEKVDETLDWGERIRLLKRPSTWVKELAEQAEGVQKYGCRRSRRRPTEPKVITTSTSRKQQRRSLL